MISLVPLLPILRRSDEEDDAAHPQPGFSTPTKACHDDRAGHADSDAELTDSESESDVEEELEESTGKNSKYSACLNYTKSCGGRKAQIPYWSPRKSVIKFTLS